MTAVYSSTWDNQYLFYLPITAWCWKMIATDSLCFLPASIAAEDLGKMKLVLNTAFEVTNGRFKSEIFHCPQDKEATYAQCARLYAANLDFLPEEEVLITSDIDMAVFKVPPFYNGLLTGFGTDLAPDNQCPICYVSGPANQWRARIGNLTVQKQLDNLLGEIECENFRGNYWAKDQETLFKLVQNTPFYEINRAHTGTQFATNRIDRDDAHFMDRLSPNIIDYHMHRPGYTDENFAKILTVIKYFYPNEDLSWMQQYRQDFLKFINDNSNGS